MAEKPICFVITPIGEEGTDIRRHIDGIIEAAIRPALGDKYEVYAAHQIQAPGNIIDQVIREIDKAALVIVNLTNRNPNVMYELGVCHTMRKPTIMIAQEGTENPSDIIMERRITYQYDPLGTVKLQQELKNAEATINFEEPDSPVMKVLHDYRWGNQIMQQLAVQGNKKDGTSETLGFIIKKLEALETAMQTQKKDGEVKHEIREIEEFPSFTDHSRSLYGSSVSIPIHYSGDSKPDAEWLDRKKEIVADIDAAAREAFVFLKAVDIKHGGAHFMIISLISWLSEFSDGDIGRIFKKLVPAIPKILEKHGFEGVSLLDKRDR